MRRASLAAPLVALVCGAGCFVARPEGTHSGSPADVAVAGALEAREVAEGAPSETAYGWRLEIVGDRARYYACTAVDACTFRRMDVSAESVRATKVVARVRPTRQDGTTAEEVDVYELTFARELSTTRGGATTDGRGLLVR